MIWANGSIMRLLPHWYTQNQRDNIDDLFSGRVGNRPFEITREQVFVFWNRVKSWGITGDYTVFLQEGYDESQQFFLVDIPISDRDLREYPTSFDPETGLALDPIIEFQDPEIGTGALWAYYVYDFDIPGVHVFNGDSTPFTGKISLQFGQFAYPRPAGDPDLPAPLTTWARGGYIQCAITVLGETWFSETHPAFEHQCESREKTVTFLGDFPDVDPDNGLKTLIVMKPFNYPQAIDSYIEATDDVKLIPGSWLPYLRSEFDPRYDPETGQDLDLLP